MFLSRLGYFLFASAVFVGLGFLLSLYVSFTWGADLPQALLSFALVIIISGILINTKFSIFLTGLTSVLLFTLSYLQIQNLIPVKSYWRARTFSLSDILVIIVTFFLITVLCWLSNREIERSLKRARRSEMELKKEKDLLEVKVEDRTKKLRQAQLEKLSQMYKMAAFGSLASGLFHDLASPITALSLCLDQLKNNPSKEMLEARENLDHALNTTKKIGSFVEASKKQIKEQEEKIVFSVNREIDQVIRIFSYQAKKRNIEIIFQAEAEINLFGSPVRFHQLLSNLISNAIDAYDGLEKKGKKILIKLSLKEQGELIIKDWGRGIEENIIEKIFEPLFTTKSLEKGTGIGLYISKNIAENDFNGLIRAKSVLNQETEFIFTFPLK